MRFCLAHTLVRIYSFAPSELLSVDGDAGAAAAASVVVVFASIFFHIIWWSLHSHMNTLIHSNGCCCVLCARIHIMHLRVYLTFCQMHRPSMLCVRVYNNPKWIAFRPFI